MPLAFLGAILAPIVGYFMGGVLGGGAGIAIDVTLFAITIHINK
jgi:hypothetical protein